jgi:hypothetical protein
MLAMVEKCTFLNTIDREYSVNRIFSEICSCKFHG